MNKKLLEASIARNATKGIPFQTTDAPRRSGGRRFQTRDSTLSYFVNQLENFDPRLYEPLVEVSWGRDIKLRSGITMANESTSFIQAAFAGAGTLQNTTGNFPWISAETTAIPGVSINGQKVTLPLRLLGREISYTSVELERSQLVGQPIDVQKLDAMNILYQMNTDQMVYIGSSDVGATGLVNNANVVVNTVSTGVSGNTQWVDKTADEILADVNAELAATWLTAAYAVCPGKLLLPPNQFSYIASQKVSSAGNVSILKFLKENTISLEINGRPLDIQPVKWLAGAGADGEDRMVVYTNEENRVRFPMVPIRRETAYYQGIRFTAPYIWAFGEMEVVYPETIGYADGI
jgi:hypothetical protein